MKLHKKIISWKIYARENDLEIKFEKFIFMKFHFF